ncbi:MAG: hypothetical protein ACOC38_06730 [Promethearchaeia archaeon]
MIATIISYRADPIGDTIGRDRIEVPANNRFLAMFFDDYTVLYPAKMAESCLSLVHPAVIGAFLTHHLAIQGNIFPKPLIPPDFSMIFHAVIYSVRNRRETLWTIAYRLGYYSALMVRAYHHIPVFDLVG